ncbi:MAG: translation initiation factor IF-5A [Nanoarchaeota archaeon]|nr:translation initiation factor IF-5A [Nanoarchaeota archaeon]MBU4086529.1 translation initiation factor IF-5A [Nanoarchaeota archaeon]
MAFKLINAHDVKEGTSIIVDGAPCTARGNDISKTGKHGASKCRIECIGVLDGKKRIVAVPGHERFEVPLIEKKRGQILSVLGDTASVMDSESFETFEIPISEDVREEAAEEKQCEYWIIDGIKVLKRVMN